MLETNHHCYAVLYLNQSTEIDHPYSVADRVA